MEHLSDDELNSRRLHHTAFADSLAVADGRHSGRSATGQTCEAHVSQVHAREAQRYRRELARRRKEAG
jgi:3-dehydroquinate dehydratase